jgi:hypothetical protein
MHPRAKQGTKIRYNSKSVIFRNITQKIQIQNTKIAMKSYRIIWEIDVEANNPTEAAAKAQLIQQDKGSEATIFEVYEDGKYVETLDLFNNESYHNENAPKYFKNDFESWCETNFEIVKAITEDLNKPEPFFTVLQKRLNEQGTGGLYELAQDLTDKFEEKFKDHIWDGEFFDEIENFIHEELR